MNKTNAARPSTERAALTKNDAIVTQKYTPSSPLKQMDSKGLSRNGHSVESVEHIEEINPAEAWHPIIPLSEFSLPEFPLQCLPEPLRGMVEAVAANREIPLEIPTVAGLAAVSTALTKKIQVNGGENWFEPVNLYLVGAYPSGGGKSGTFNDMTKVIYEYEASLQQEYQAKVERINAQQQERQQIKGKVSAKAAEADDPAEKTALEETAEAIQEEIEAVSLFEPTLITDDATPETVKTLLYQNQGRLANLSSEGELFEMIAGRYKDKGVALSPYLEGFSGDPIKVHRQNRRENISSALITIGIMPQPDVIRGLAEKEGFRGRGLLARFLFFLPASRLGYRTGNNPAIPERVRSDYEVMLTRLLCMEPKENTRRGMKPYTLTLEPQAYRTFQEFRREVEEKMRPDGELGDHQDFGGKLPGMALRVAGLFHMIQGDSVEDKISFETLNHALTFIRFSLFHVRAAYGEMGMDSAYEGAKEILKWIEAKPKIQFTRRDVHMAKPTKFKRAEDLNAPLSLLCERGYLREKVTLRRLTVGRKPEPTYEVNPDALPREFVQSHSAVPQIALQLSVFQSARVHAVSIERQRNKEFVPREQSSGSPESDYENTYFGTCVEFGLVNWLRSKGVSVDNWIAAKEGTAPEGCDIWIEGVRFEIKAAPPDQAFFHVSHRQHKNPTRRAEYYVFGAFISEKTFVLYAPVPYHEVVNWENYSRGHEPCYEKPRDALTPLTSLEQITRLLSRRNPSTHSTQLAADGRSVEYVEPTEEIDTVWLNE